MGRTALRCAAGSLEEVRGAVLVPRHEVAALGVRGAAERVKEHKLLLHAARLSHVVQMIVLSAHHDLSAGRSRLLTLTTTLRMKRGLGPLGPSNSRRRLWLGCAASASAAFASGAAAPAPRLAACVATCPVRMMCHRNCAQAQTHARQVRSHPSKGRLPRVVLAGWLSPCTARQCHAVHAPGVLSACGVLRPLAGAPVRLPPPTTRPWHLAPRLHARGAPARSAAVSSAGGGPRHDHP